MTGHKTGVVHLAGSHVRSNCFARRKPRTLRCPATLRWSFVSERWTGMGVCVAELEAGDTRLG